MSKSKNPAGANAPQSKRVRPILYKGTQDLPVPMSMIHDLFHAIQSSGMHADFLSQSIANEATVNVPPATVNFVKKFIADNGMHALSTVAGDVMKSNDPRCKQDPNAEN